MRDLIELITEEEDRVNSGPVPKRSVKQSSTLDRMRRYVLEKPEYQYRQNPNAFNTPLYDEKTTMPATRMGLMVGQPQWKVEMFKQGAPLRRKFDVGVQVPDLENEPPSEQELGGKTEIFVKPTIGDNKPGYSHEFSGAELLTTFAPETQEPKVDIPTPAFTPSKTETKTVRTEGNGSVPFDRNYLTLLGRSGAQIGSLYGKMASAEPLADYIKSLEDQDRAQMGIAQKEKELDKPISEQEAFMTNAMLKKYGIDVDVTGMSRKELEKSPTLKSILDMIKYQEKPDVFLTQNTATGEVTRWDRKTGKQLPTEPYEQAPARPAAPAAPAIPVAPKVPQRSTYQDVLDEITKDMRISPNIENWTEQQTKDVITNLKAVMQNVRDPQTGKPFPIDKVVNDIARRRMLKPSQMPLPATPTPVPTAAPTPKSEIPTREEIRNWEPSDYINFKLAVNQKYLNRPKDAKEIIDTVDGYWKQIQESENRKQTQEAIDKRSENAARRARERDDYKFTRDETRKYQQDLTKHNIPTLTASVDEVDAVLPGGLWSNEDIPGSGGLYNAFPSNFWKSADGRKINQAITRLFNTVLRDRSGAAVTIGELERLKGEFGTTWGNTVADLRAGLQSYVRILNREIQGIQGGYSPEARKRYEEQGGAAVKVPPAPGATSTGESVLERLRRERERRQKEGK